MMIVIAIPDQDSDDWSEQVLAVRKRGPDGGCVHTDVGACKDASLVTKSDQMLQLSEKVRPRAAHREPLTWRDAPT